MARAAAIILQNNSLALIERNRNGQIYYLFPGGQVEAGESQVETVTREVKEEIGLEISVGRLIAEVIFNGKSQFHYLADILGGEFGTGMGEEFLSRLPSEYGTYSAVWIPLTDLLKLDLRPKAVVDLVVRSQTDGWPRESLVVKEGD
ncbi:MAG TPA: NUDIX domain-containing protein [Anaerolineales bacterium]|jgi:8-oxo-dGTP pyrophosphatase MutT (NUDIX family)|nr:NUDIX domain-containing protein [Anaerolineales bacterium]